METHVEKKHVGKDAVLVKASILVPNNLEYLKIHQCGIRLLSKLFFLLQLNSLHRFRY